MLTRKLFNLTWRLSLAWIVISVIGLFYGQQLLAALLPLFSFVIACVQEDFQPTLDIAPINGDITVRMAAKVLRTIPLSTNQFIAPGTFVNYTAIGTLHALVPAVLLLTFIVAWPIQNWREGIRRGLLSVPAFFLVILITTPLFLIGRFQMAIVDMATPSGESPNNNFFVLWTLLLEMGGNWLLPILMAVFCILKAEKLAAREALRITKFRISLGK